MFFFVAARYVGLPCLVDADCFTKCRKPALASLQVGGLSRLSYFYDAWTKLEPPKITTNLYHCVGSWVSWFFLQHTSTITIYKMFDFWHFRPIVEFWRLSDLLGAGPDFFPNLNLASKVHGETAKVTWKYWNRYCRLGKNGIGNYSDDNGQEIPTTSL